MDHPLIFGLGTTVVDPVGGSVAVLGGTSVLQVQPQMLRPAGFPYHGELQYLALMQELLDKYDEDPTPREERTGTGTKSVFGRQIRFDLSHGFPLLTTKRVFWRGVVAELLWMLAGETNIKSLVDQNVHIWDEWADENGELGPVYGKQWRDWNGSRRGSMMRPLDQIQNVIKSIKTNPNSRRHIVTAWNPAEVDDMALPPCHMLFQFFVEDGKLSCQLYQRSADIFLGVPFNIASYALLTHMIARETGLFVGEFIHTFGDLHLYANHVDQAREQVSRTPRPFPTVNLPIRENHVDIFNLAAPAIILDGYDPHPTIKGDVSV